MIRIRFDGRSVDRFLSARLTGLPWLCVEYSHSLPPAGARYRGPVTVEDAAPPTRRDRRWRTSPSPAPTAARTALAWVDADALSPARSSSAGAASFDLLPPLRRRRRVRGRVVGIPAAAILTLAAGYCAAALLWPLSAVAPTASETEVAPLTGAASAIDWPAEGTSAVGVDGFAPATSSDAPAQMASTTKLVTALVILDAAPLAVGEHGPSYDFTFADRQEYWSYISGNQSALNVPDGGSLTEYQLLQGMLIASASNYADRLATDAFGSIEAYTSAANAWLAENGLDGITVTDASGFDRGNEATPAAMIALAERALGNPVIAEIVATPSAELPGAGAFENTNALLGEEGVVGLKTGSYGGYYNLLAARTEQVGDADVTIFASVAGQPTDTDRVDAAKGLLAAVSAEAATPSTLPAGTVVGEVTTAWGASSAIVTDADASLLLWNGATAEDAASFDLGDEIPAGAKAGTFTLTGPAGSIDVPVSVTDAVEGPDAWWRLTHPLDLLGTSG
jgi:D-alanyl-D-alanine carboxypeptidase (penicillin-binding protein 5/6)